MGSGAKMDQLELDSLLLARAMMYRSRQRRRASKPTTPAASDSIGLDLSTSPLMEYVGRGLSRAGTPYQEESASLSLGSHPETSLCGDEDGALQPVSSELSQEQNLLGVADRLAEIGDQGVVEMEDEMRNALGQPEIQTALKEGVTALAYTTWRKIVSPFVACSSSSSFGEARRRMAALFRFTERFLSAADEAMDGEVDLNLEQKLEDHNKQVLIDLFRAIYQRANGFKALVEDKPSEPEGASSSADSAV